MTLMLFRDVGAIIPAAPCSYRLPPLSALFCTTFSRGLLMRCLRVASGVRGQRLGSDLSTTSMHFPITKTPDLGIDELPQSVDESARFEFHFLAAGCHNSHKSLYLPPRSCSWRTGFGEYIRKPTGIMQGELSGVLASHF